MPLPLMFLLPRLSLWPWLLLQTPFGFSSDRADIWGAVGVLWGELVIFTILAALALRHTDPPQPQPTGGKQRGLGPLQPSGTAAMEFCDRESEAIGAKLRRHINKGDRPSPAYCFLVSAVPEAEGRKEISRGIFGRLRRQLAMAPITSFKQFASGRVHGAPFKATAGRPASTCGMLGAPWCSGASTSHRSHGWPPAVVWRCKSVHACYDGGLHCQLQSTARSGGYGLASRQPDTRLGCTGWD